MNETLQQRLQRVLPPQRKALIVPIDHGLSMGNLPGLERPRALLHSLRQAGVDGTLMSAGLAKRIGAERGEMSLTLTLDFQLWSTQPGVQAAIQAEIPVSTVRRAEALGAQAVKLLFPWGLPPQVIRENLVMIAQVAEEADRAGFPLMLEPLWMGSALDAEEHDRVIVHAARIAVELGADILKIPVVGEAALEQILAWEIPTVFLGGARQDNPEALYRRIAEGLRMGARGVVIGRNVWQRPDMAEAIAAIRASM
ncbi:MULTISPECIES: class I fructose-bisphosphate aldolase [unclassified Meiothermus]|uniref:class I fructose-bisphosphate aldolase n=1 Tax=unclassified Meiothermus TaxID=370471 RepID=UPI000D7BD402|nr:MULTISPECIES: deoxyribose-phosphate aldolase [unclassified Meiothermus]PZA07124.1 deoxyribose-phosphate aldolase [Meiothermus sp. Pnk-1]RYM39993.1 deoxyribose-phosphate aldolase [Meiothermus sp. PNK-Is4]